MGRPKNITPMIKATLFFLRIITPSLRFETFHLTGYIFLMSAEPWKREAHDPLCQSSERKMAVAEIKSTLELVMEKTRGIKRSGRTKK